MTQKEIADDLTEFIETLRSVKRFIQNHFDRDTDGAVNSERVKMYDHVDRLSAIAAELTRNRLVKYANEELDSEQNS